MLAALLIVVFVVLHQDFWFWRSLHPLVFGFMPIGLFYHAAFTIACALLMAFLVKSRWPHGLEALSRRPVSTGADRRGPSVVDRAFTRE
jgi:hypothetical protein